MMLYSPSGCPTWVPDSLLPDYKKRGYTPRKPLSALTQEVKAVLTEAVGTPPEVPPANDPLEDVDLTPNQMQILNYASKEELMSIRGIGPAIAEKIMEQRPITSKDYLQRVSATAKWEEILAQIQR